MAAPRTNPGRSGSLTRPADDHSAPFASLASKMRQLHFALTSSGIAEQAHLEQNLLEVVGYFASRRAAGDTSHSTAFLAAVATTTDLNGTPGAGSNADAGSRPSNSMMLIQLCRGVVILLTDYLDSGPGTTGPAPGSIAGADGFPTSAGNPPKPRESDRALLMESLDLAVSCLLRAHRSEDISVRLAATQCLSILGRRLSQTYTVSFLTTLIKEFRRTSPSRMARAILSLLSSILWTIDPMPITSLSDASNFLLEHSPINPRPPAPNRPRPPPSLTFRTASMITPQLIRFFSLTSDTALQETLGSAGPSIFAFFRGYFSMIPCPTRFALRPAASAGSEPEEEVATQLAASAQPVSCMPLLSALTQSLFLSSANPAVLRTAVDSLAAFALAASFLPEDHPQMPTCGGWSPVACSTGRLVDILLESCLPMLDGHILGVLLPDSPAAEKDPLPEYVTRALHPDDGSADRLTIGCLDLLAASPSSPPDSPADSAASTASSASVAVISSHLRAVRAVVDIGAASIVAALECGASADALALGASPPSDDGQILTWLRLVGVQAGADPTECQWPRRLAALLRLAQGLLMDLRLASAALDLLLTILSLLAVLDPAGAPARTALTAWQGAPLGPGLLARRLAQLAGADAPGTFISVGVDRPVVRFPRLPVPARVRALQCLATLAARWPTDTLGGAPDGAPPLALLRPMLGVGDPLLVGRLCTVYGAALTGQLAVLSERYTAAGSTGIAALPAWIEPVGVFLSTAARGLANAGFSGAGTLPAWLDPGPIGAGNLAESLADPVCQRLVLAACGRATRAILRTLAVLGPTSTVSSPPDTIHRVLLSLLLHLLASAIWVLDASSDQGTYWLVISEAVDLLSRMDWGLLGVLLPDHLSEVEQLNERALTALLRLHLRAPRARGATPRHRAILQVGIFVHVSAGQTAQLDGHAPLQETLLRQYQHRAGALVAGLLAQVQDRRVEDGPRESAGLFLRLVDLLLSLATAVPAGPGAPDEPTPPAAGRSPHLPPGLGHSLWRGTLASMARHGRCLRASGPLAGQPISPGVTPLAVHLSPLADESPILATGDRALLRALAALHDDPSLASFGQNTAEGLPLLSSGVASGLGAAGAAADADADPPLAFHPAFLRALPAIFADIAPGQSASFLACPPPGADPTATRTLAHFCLSLLAGSLQADLAVSAFGSSLRSADGVMSDGPVLAVTLSLEDHVALMRLLLALSAGGLRRVGSSALRDLPSRTWLWPFFRYCVHLLRAAADVIREPLSTSVIQPGGNGSTGGPATGSGANAAGASAAGGIGTTGSSVPASSQVTYAMGPGAMHPGAGPTSSLLLVHSYQAHGGAVGTGLGGVSLPTLAPVNATGLPGAPVPPGGLTVPGAISSLAAYHGYGQAAGSIAIGNTSSGSWPEVPVSFSAGIPAAEASLRLSFADSEQMPIQSPPLLAVPLAGGPGSLPPLPTASGSGGSAGSGPAGASGGSIPPRAAASSLETHRRLSQSIAAAYRTWYAKFIPAAGRTAGLEDARDPFLHLVTTVAGCLSCLIPELLCEQERLREQEHRRRQHHRSAAAGDRRADSTQRPAPTAPGSPAEDISLYSRSLLSDAQSLARIAPAACGSVISVLLAMASSPGPGSRGSASGSPADGATPELALGRRTAAMYLPPSARSAFMAMTAAGQPLYFEGIFDSALPSGGAAAALQGVLQAAEAQAGASAIRHLALDPDDRMDLVPYAGGVDIGSFEKVIVQFMHIFPQLGSFRRGPELATPRRVSLLLVRQALRARVDIINPAFADALLVELHKLGLVSAAGWLTGWRGPVLLSGDRVTGLHWSPADAAAGLAACLAELTCTLLALGRYCSVGNLRPESIIQALELALQPLRPATGDWKTGLAPGGLAGALCPGDTCRATAGDAGSGAWCAALFATLLPVYSLYLLLLSSSPDTWPGGWARPVGGAADTTVPQDAVFPFGSLVRLREVCRQMLSLCTCSIGAGALLYLADLPLPARPRLEEIRQASTAARQLDPSGQLEPSFSLVEASQWFLRAIRPPSDGSVGMMSAASERAAWRDTMLRLGRLCFGRTAPAPLADAWRSAVRTGAQDSAHVLSELLAEAVDAGHRLDLASAQGPAAAAAAAAAAADAPGSADAHGRPSFAWWLLMAAQAGVDVGVLRRLAAKHPNPGGLSSSMDHAAAKQACRAILARAGPATGSPLVHWARLAAHAGIPLGQAMRILAAEAGKRPGTHWLLMLRAWLREARSRLLLEGGPLNLPSTASYSDVAALLTRDHIGEEAPLLAALSTAWATAPEQAPCPATCEAVTLLLRLRPGAGMVTADARLDQLLALSFLPSVDLVAVMDAMLPGEGAPPDPAAGLATLLATSFGPFHRTLKAHYQARASDSACPEPGPVVPLLEAALHLRQTLGGRLPGERSALCADMDARLAARLPGPKPSPGTAAQAASSPQAASLLSARPCMAASLGTSAACQLSDPDPACGLCLGGRASTMVRRLLGSTPQADAALDLTLLHVALLQGSRDALHPARNVLPDVDGPGASIPLWLRAALQRLLEAVALFNEGATSLAAAAPAGQLAAQLHDVLRDPVLGRLIDRVISLLGAMLHLFPGWWTAHERASCLRFCATFSLGPASGPVDLASAGQSLLLGSLLVATACADHSAGDLDAGHLGNSFYLDTSMRAFSQAGRRLCPELATHLPALELPPVGDLLGRRFANALAPLHRDRAWLGGLAAACYVAYGADAGVAGLGQATSSPLAGAHPLSRRLLAGCARWASPALVALILGLGHVPQFGLAMDDMPGSATGSDYIRAWHPANIAQTASELGPAAMYDEPSAMVGGDEAGPGGSDHQDPAAGLPFLPRGARVPVDNPSFRGLARLRALSAVFALAGTAGPLPGRLSALATGRSVPGGADTGRRGSALADAPAGLLVLDSPPRSPISGPTTPASAPPRVSQGDRDLGDLATGLEALQLAPGDSQPAVCFSDSDDLGTVPLAVGSDLDLAMSPDGSTGARQLLLGMRPAVGAPSDTGDLAADDASDVGPLESPVLGRLSESLDAPRRSSAGASASYWMDMVERRRADDVTGVSPPGVASSDSVPAAGTPPAGGASRATGTSPGAHGASTTSNAPGTSASQVDLCLVRAQGQLATLLASEAPCPEVDALLWLAVPAGPIPVDAALRLLAACSPPLADADDGDLFFQLDALGFDRWNRRLVDDRWTARRLLLHAVASVLGTHHRATVGLPGPLRLAGGASIDWADAGLAPGWRIYQPALDRALRHFCDVLAAPVLAATTPPHALHQQAALVAAASAAAAAAAGSTSNAADTASGLLSSASSMYSSAGGSFLAGGAATMHGAGGEFPPSHKVPPGGGAPEESTLAGDEPTLEHLLRYAAGRRAFDQDLLRRTTLQCTGRLAELLFDPGPAGTPGLPLCGRRYARMDIIPTGPGSDMAATTGLYDDATAPLAEWALNASLGILRQAGMTLPTPFSSMLFTPGIVSSLQELQRLEAHPPGGAGAAPGSSAAVSLFGPSPPPGGEYVDRNVSVSGAPAAAASAAFGSGASPGPARLLVSLDDAEALGWLLRILLAALRRTDLSLDQPGSQLTKTAGIFRELAAVLDRGLRHAHRGVQQSILEGSLALLLDAASFLGRARCSDGCQTDLLESVSLASRCPAVAGGVVAWWLAPLLSLHCRREVGALLGATLASARSDGAAPSLCDAFVGLSLRATSLALALVPEAFRAPGAIGLSPYAGLGAGAVESLAKQLYDLAAWACSSAGVQSAPMRRGLLRHAFDSLAFLSMARSPTVLQLIKFHAQRCATLLTALNSEPLAATSAAVAPSSARGPTGHNACLTLAPREALRFLACHLRFLTCTEDLSEVHLSAMEKVLVLLKHLPTLPVPAREHLAAALPYLLTGSVAVGDLHRSVDVDLLSMTDPFRARGIVSWLPTSQALATVVSYMSRHTLVLPTPSPSTMASTSAPSGPGSDDTSTTYSAQYVRAEACRLLFDTCDLLRLRNAHPAAQMQPLRDLALDFRLQGYWLCRSAGGSEAGAFELAGPGAGIAAPAAPLRITDIWPLGAFDSTQPPAEQLYGRLPKFGPLPVTLRAHTAEGKTLPVGAAGAGAAGASHSPDVAAHIFNFIISAQETLTQAATGPAGPADIQWRVSAALAATVETTSATAICAEPAAAPPAVDRPRRVHTTGEGLRARRAFLLAALNGQHFFGQVPESVPASVTAALAQSRDSRLR
ncbi:hypothetical protein H696_03071 [Fonticula alba]|uniref:Uncharacterized protein n=1 Tax=Fonticula alba TaxID=691883 RepID=A0A058Z8T2_FONAL|nr:hypothetical protein H696_03071 [Fonticula alba]KCV70719.1 hypothetical protein H696_03071 [Fonticula alba]|eukprot:XP_009495235.1 hypothetical protein H696_03071 [Fonticula alba]